MRAVSDVLNCFQYPMYPREYVYVRRAWVNSRENVMVLNSKAAEHPAFPPDSDHIRVDVYSAQLVIRPHAEFKDVLKKPVDNPKNLKPFEGYYRYR